MEAILNKLGNAPDSKSVTGLGDSIQSAKDVFAIKASTPSYKVRQKLLDVFSKIFASGKPKLIIIATEGLQGIIRDESLNTDKDGCCVADSFITQMLRCLALVSDWKPQIQCSIFTVIVQLISNNEFQVTISHVFNAIQICSKTYLSSVDPAVKLAVRATLTQMLNSFCLNRQLRAESNNQEDVAVLMDMTTLLNEILPRLDCNLFDKNSTDELQLALDALYSIISVLPAFFFKHSPIINLFIAELIPALINLLQMSSEEETPVVLTITKSKLTKQLTFRNTNSKPQVRPNIFATPELARSFYQVTEQILQLFFERLDEAKLILELYRAALLVTPSTKRLEALKLIKRMVSTSSRMIIFLKGLSNEPLYWLIPMQCLEECSKCTNPEICIEALNCLNSLFTSLFEFVTSMDLNNFSTDFVQQLDEEFVEKKSSRSTVQLLKQTNSKDCLEESKLTALKFVGSVQQEIPKWFKMTDQKLIDENIQEFSVELSRELSEIKRKNSCENDSNQSFSLAFNALSIYLTTYAALDFLFRVHNNHDFQEFEVWIAKVLIAGTNTIDVCIDKEWLFDVYNILCSKIILNNEFKEKSEFELIIDDYDGFLNESFVHNKVKKSESYKELKDVVDCKSRKKIENWIKNILASCWGSILAVLSKFLLRDNKKTILFSTAKGLNSVGIAISGVVNNSGANTTILSDKLCVDSTKATLESIQSLIALLIRFSMDKELIWVYEKMGEEICQLEELRQLTTEKILASNNFKKPWLLLNRNDAFAIAIMLENAIKYSTLPNGIWKYVVRCIDYTLELERFLFQTRKQATYDVNFCPTEDQIPDVFLNYQQNELSNVEVSKVLNELLLKIETFFENASKNLNLPSICALLTALIATNEDNLKYSGEISTSSFLRYTSCVLLQKISQLVCGVSSRNFIHLIKVWSCVKDHYTETAFAKFPDEVSKMSICCTYDSMKALLINENCGMKWQFNFNKALFSVYQNILCSDVSKIETQEHVVSVLGTFIEENADRIGTGWKPLFGTLKAIHVCYSRAAVLKRLPSEIIDENFQNSLILSSVNVAILDVFKKYLFIKDENVLYSSLLDYIHCLINYLRSASTFSINLNDEKTDEELEAEEFIVKEIGCAVFDYIQKLQTICFCLYNKADIIFVNVNLLNKLFLREKSLEFANSQSVNDRLNLIDDLSTILCGSYVLNVQALQLVESTKNINHHSLPWKNWTDQQKCIGELFLSLIDDLCGLLVNCSQKIHLKIISFLSNLFYNLKSSKIGPAFGIFSLCTQILPTLQKWVQNSTHGFLPANKLPVETRNLKQCTGIFTQIVVDYIYEFTDFEPCKILLSDTLILFNEFISHSSQFISAIGCSCLKHLLFSDGITFTSEIWSVIALSLWKAISLTLLPIRMLILQFFSESTEFCGDMGQMSVTIDNNKNITDDIDYTELQVMAKQVFLMSSIEADNVENSTQKFDQFLLESSKDGQRHQFAYKFVFNNESAKSKTTENLLYANSETANKVFLGLDEVVTSLMNHQMIVQIISQLLTNQNDMNSCFEKNNYLMPSQLNNEKIESKGIVFQSKSLDLTEPNGKLTIATLIYCLQASSIIAEQFDQRPALKFLLQKLFHLDEYDNGSLVNLYNTHSACKSLELWTLFQVLQLIEDESVIWPIIDKTLKNVLSNLRKAEKNAAFYKLAIFAREKFNQPVQFLLVESQLLESESGKESNVSCFKVVPNDYYLKGYQRQKKAETLPTLTMQSDISNRINPFMSSKTFNLSDQTEIDNDDLNNLQQGLKLSQLNDMDVCILAHSEIFAIFLEKFLLYTNSLEFQKFVPKLLSHIQEFMLITGNGRARFVVAKFLKRLENESFNTNQH